MHRLVSALVLVLAVARPALAQSDFRTYAGCNTFACVSITQTLNDGTIGWPAPSADWQATVTFREGPGFLAGNTNWPGTGSSGWDLYSCCGAPGAPMGIAFNGRWSPLAKTWTIPVWALNPGEPLPPAGDLGIPAAFIGTSQYVTVTATPEPASLALVATGLLAVGAIARRRRRVTLR
jgi:hypothetical protein